MIDTLAELTRFHARERADQEAMVYLNDGRTWTIKLHEGITFSDGTPVTAQTFVDFVDWWQSTELSYWYAETLSLESMEAIDELTLTYTTYDGPELGHAIRVEFFDHTGGNQLTQVGIDNIALAAEARERIRGTLLIIQ